MSKPHESELNAQPRWLWPLVRGGFIVLLVTIAGLALAVMLGLADPRPVGQLQWEDDFSDPVSRWAVGVGGPVVEQPAALRMDRPGLTLLVHNPDATEYTFAVAGYQPEGSPGAGYGLAFDVRSAGDYTVVLINNNGFVSAWRQAGAVREDLYPWQAWPHILRGEQANAIQVTVRAGQAEIRINDEFFLTLPSMGGGVALAGWIDTPGQAVQFGWAKFWSR